MQINSFIDMTDDNLVENTLSYANDIPMEVVTNSSIPDNLHDVITRSESSNNPSKHVSSGIETHYLPSSISHHIEIPVEIVGVIEKQPLSRKNISRRSRRSVLGLQFDDNLIDHPPLPSDKN
ncbi:hypothetical protein CASFOL_000365 [Castilleja foliolosa]|uniref:Uncharacterized protein n=1 Tax=Castilleja foliolosa TaxID=1961234 RepID=A0ABD3ESG0_9LAMI